MFLVWDKEPDRRKVSIITLEAFGSNNYQKTGLCFTADETAYDPDYFDYVDPDSMIRFETNSKKNRRGSRIPESGYPVNREFMETEPVMGMIFKEEIEEKRKSIS